MNYPVPIALFRLSLLGPLVSRTRLTRGELKGTLRELASKEYDIPGSRRRQVAEKTLQTWYYRYQREGLAGLALKPRSDQGRSKIDAAVQERLLAAKRENPRRSIHMLQQLLEAEGVVPRGVLSRSAIHRFLRRYGLSRPVGAESQPEERRSFLAEHAGQTSTIAARTRASPGSPRSSAISRICPCPPAGVAGRAAGCDLPASRAASGAQGRYGLLRRPLL